MQKPSLVSFEEIFGEYNKLAQEGKTSAPLLSGETSLSTLSVVDFNSPLVGDVCVIMNKKLLGLGLLDMETPANFKKLDLLPDIKKKERINYGAPSPRELFNTLEVAPAIATVEHLIEAANTIITKRFLIANVITDLALVD